mgnify:CR=1 FL=1
MDTVQPWALRLHVERASCCCLHTCDMNVQIQCNVTHVTRMMLWGSFYKCGAVRVSMGVHHGPYSARTNPAAVPRPLLEQTGVPASSLEAIAVACSATPSHCTCRRVHGRAARSPKLQAAPAVRSPKLQAAPAVRSPKLQATPAARSPKLQAAPAVVGAVPQVGSPPPPVEPQQGGPHTGLAGRCPVQPNPHTPNPNPACMRTSCTQGST